MGNVPPAAVTPLPRNGGWDGHVVLFGIERDNITIELRLLWLVMLFAAIGSYVHVATSFADFVGNRRLRQSWLLWYVLQPPVGVALALIFYVGIRGGFIPSNNAAATRDLNPFGTALFSALIGLFSKQATNKLSEVFNTLFHTAPGAGDDARGGKLKNPIPTITDIDPKRVPPNASTRTITVTGSGFTEGSKGRVLGHDRATSYRNPTLLVVTLEPVDVKVEGNLSLTVFNSEPGGGTSLPHTIVVGASPPAVLPVITGVEPNAGALAGRQRVVISGEHFAGTSSVAFGGVEATFTAESDDRLTVLSPPAEHAGPVHVTVWTTAGRSLQSVADTYTYNA
ncbi:MAG: hypothetical protein NVSMB64_11350 [Candidatus Velthaea sp.]